MLYFLRFSHHFRVVGVSSAPKDETEEEKMFQIIFGEPIAVFLSGFKAGKR